MEEKLTTGDLVDMAINYFDIRELKDADPDRDKAYIASARKTYREKIVRAAKAYTIPGIGVSLWDKAYTPSSPTKDKHRFHLQDAKYIVRVLCRNYFEKISGEDYKSAKRLADKIGSDYQSIIETTPDYYEYNDDNVMTIPDFSNKKIEIMIEALFNRYYEFDDEKFRADGLIAENVDDPRDLDVETAPAFERWNSPITYYVTEKAKNPSE